MHRRKFSYCGWGPTCRKDKRTGQVCGNLENFLYEYKEKMDSLRSCREYYSGPGSYREDLTEPYVEWLREFVTKENIGSIVDLGCGDFNEGRQLVSLVPKYTGVDIVEGVIQRNREEYGNNNVDFLCLDIVSDELPNGELCLVRQVLQHLCNAEIQEVLYKLKRYKYSVITETVYDKTRANAYSIDISKDRSTRRNQKSGVYLDEAPFNEKIEILKVLPYSENIDLVISLLCSDKYNLE